jgi:hypothetical protein
MNPNCKACAHLLRDQLERGRALLRCLKLMVPKLTEDTEEQEAALTLLQEINAQIRAAENTST